MRRPQGRLSFSATDASVIQVRKLVTPDPSGFRTFHIDRRRFTRTQKVSGTSRLAPQRVTAGWRRPGRRHHASAPSFVPHRGCRSVHRRADVARGRTSGSVVPSWSAAIRRMSSPGRTPTNLASRPAPNRCLPIATRWQECLILLRPTSVQPTATVTNKAQITPTRRRYLPHCLQRCTG